jgi:hypothetical protein
VEKRFELLTRELAGGPLEDGVVTEMAHHTAQIAFVNDVESQSQSTPRIERSAEARLEGPGIGEMVRQGSVSPARKQCFAAELKRLDVTRIEIDLDAVPFSSALLFTSQNIERAGRIRPAIEFMERLEAAPLTIWVGRKCVVDIRAGKTMDKRLELSGAGAQE